MWNVFVFIYKIFISKLDLIMEEMRTLLSDEHILLTENVIKLLAQNRIGTILEFLSEDPEKLSILTKLSLPQILSIRNCIFQKYSAPLINGTSLLEGVFKNKYLSTGIERLDFALNGGIQIGTITEFCGLADSGKSQLCLQLAINCVKNTERTILYVDTKADFSAVRIQKILDACGYTNKEMAMIMYRIKIIHIWTMNELVDLLKDIKNKVLVLNNLALIIIDSLPVLMFQYLGNENKIGLSLLNIFVNYSRLLCRELDISIICVNIQTRWVDQDVSELEDEGQTSISKENLYIEKYNRCLGKYWQNIPAVVLIFDKVKEVSTTDCSYINVSVIKLISKPINKKCKLKISVSGVT